jgi:hypothetical protein
VGDIMQQLASRSDNGVVPIQTLSIPDSRNPLRDIQVRLGHARQLRLAVTRVSGFAERSPQERPHCWVVRDLCLSGERDASGHD